MAQNYSRPALLCVLFIWIFSACSRDELKAPLPLYISIPEIFLETEPSEGSCHSQITTVWISANGAELAVYELPAYIPLLLQNGANDIRILPGITANGIAANRAIYTRYDEINLTVDFDEAAIGADTLQLSDSERTTRYSGLSTVEILEDFDGTGLNLERSVQADTGILKTSDPNEIFTNPQKPSEINGSAGVMYVSEAGGLSEITTVNPYDLPKGGTNVWLEMSYKCEVPFTVGVFALTPSQVIPAPTLTVNPKENWNKIYVNLVAEVSGNQGATEYKIFVRSNYDAATGEGRIWLDNLKLVY